MTDYTLNTDDRHYPRLPKSDIKELREENIRRLNEEKMAEWNERVFKGTPGKVVDRDEDDKIKSKFAWYRFFTILFFIGVIIIGSYFTYLVSQDKLKSVYSASFEPYINVTTNNQYDIPINTNNEYTFNPSNNFTIVNQLNCTTPVVNVDCNCPI